MSLLLHIHIHFHTLKKKITSLLIVWQKFTNILEEHAYPMNLKTG